MLEVLAKQSLKARKAPLPDQAQPAPPLPFLAGEKGSPARSGTAQPAPSLFLKEWMYSRLPVNISNEGALSIALSEGHLSLVSELLLQRWRRGTIAAQSTPDTGSYRVGLRCLVMDDVLKLLVGTWTMADTSLQDTNQLFTTTLAWDSDNFK